VARVLETVAMVAVATPAAVAVQAVAMVVVAAVEADAAHGRTRATHKAARAVSPHKLATRMRNPHVSSKHGPNMTTMPNPPAMSLQASPLLASPLAATVVASVAAAPQAAVVAVAAAVADHARVAVVAGATGMVGRAVLARLTADKTSAYAAVHTLGRRAPELPAGAPSARLVSHVSQSLLEVQVPPADDMFIALGTTIAVAGSQAAFRAVDLDAVLALARAARAAGVRRLGVVSAMGADAKSPVFYNRVKGEMELAVSALGFDTVVIARPSLLDGERDALGQPTRRGEQFALKVMRLLKPLIPRNYQAISDAQVAKALVEAVLAGRPGVQILLSGQMQPR
jgi:uncharacterized protein YbjT (DUF2867 family)